MPEQPQNPNDEFDDYDSFFRDERTRVNASVLSSLDEDPEKAARSIQLGEASGVPSNVINLDQESFERQHKAALATDLVSRDDFLRSYIANHPMAANLSHDDLGQLSEAGQSISAATNPSIMQRFANAWKGMTTAPEGFQRGFGPGGIGSYISPEDWVKHPEIASLGSTVFAPVELFFRGLNGIINEAADEFVGHEQGEKLAQVIGDPALVATLQGIGPHGAFSAGILNLMSRFRSTARIMDYYGRQGKPPPTGVDPFIDNVYKEQAELDAKSLDKAVSDVGKTATKERSPDYASRFAEGPAGDAKIRISADAVDRLYGDSTPEPDDGKLGFIPNLAERLDATAGSGGYIDVPLKDYLANIDPEVHREIRDDILVRDHGFTVNEAKEVPEPPKAEPAPEGEEPLAQPPQGSYTIDTPVQTLRGSAGLEPLFSVGDRKLTIVKREGPARGGPTGLIPADAPQGWSSVPGRAADEYRLHDENGNKVGWLEVIPSEDGTQLYVDNIGGFESKGFGPNSFGPALTRSLIRQLKEIYPNLKEIGGFRISGARDKSGTTGPATIKVQVGDMFDANSHERFRNLLSQNWEEVSKNVTALFDREGKGLAADTPLGQLVLSELHRIVPQAESDVAHAIALRGEPVRGVFIPNMREVIVSLTNPEPIGTAHHESIHALYRMGLFSGEEWNTLLNASKDQNWRERFQIDERWAHIKDAPLDEEAIAEGFRLWRRDKTAAGLTPEVKTLFQRIEDFFEGIRQRLAELFGHELSWEQIFEKADSGEIGRRDMEHPHIGPEDAAAALPEGPEPTKIKSPFARGKDIGLRQDIYERYMKLIQKRHEADLAADFGEAHERERIQQSREWKENAKEIRDQVTEELDQKPNIALDRLFAEKGGQLKIDPMSISEAQRELLPREYLRRTNSVAADDLASYFGYPSGDAMVEHLAGVAQERKASGLSHREFTEKLVNDEVSRRMEAQFGYLEKNVLEEAKDWALSQNQIDILDLETMLLAWRGGEELPLTRGAINAELRRSFNATPVESISSDVWTKAAGKAGRETEEALLKEDRGEALKAKQRQANATQQAKWAHEYEKQRKQLDKTAKQHSKKEPPGSIAPEFNNHIADQLRRAGYGGRRSWDNIKENLEGQSITEFADEYLDKSWGMLDLPIADFVAKNADWRKPVDEMTHGEFLQFKGMIDGLVQVGRDQMKFGKADAKAQLDAARAEFRARLSEGRDEKLPAYGKLPSWGRSMLARSTSIPTVFNLFDRLDRNGPWNVLARRFIDQGAEANLFEKAVEKEWKALGDFGDMSKRLTPPPMMPKWSESYSSFTRQNLLGMIANAGNRSNWVKLTEGWGVKGDAAKFGSKDPNSLWQWMVQNSTREDWQRAQKMGDNIFKKIVTEGDKVQERTTGYTVDKLPLEQIELDFADGQQPLQLNGWYHKLIPDQIWYSEKQKRGRNVYDDSPFGHIMTSDGWTRSRTRAVYPIDLGFGMLPARLSQMIHDITHRELVLDAQKIMLDPAVKNDITKYWGKEYTDMMRPFLEEVAGANAMPSANMARMEQVSEFLRQNTMTTYIGFNPSTPMKHFPTALFQSLREGQGYFLKNWAQQWMGFRPNQGNFWGEFAMDHSEILQGRDRHWRDVLGSSLEFPKADFDFTDWRDWRGAMSRWGSKVVAWSDMASAKALWIGQYQRYLDDGISAREAISRANQDVIRQHGALLLSNKPEIVRQRGNLHGWLTSVYGFMGERFQRLRETAWKTNEAWNLMEKKEFDKGAAMIPGIAADYLTYVVSVGLWEEAATMALSGDHKSGGMRLFNIAFGNIASSIIYAREIYHAAESGQDPGVGLLSSAAADIHNSIRDLFKGKEALNKEHAGRTLRHMTRALGIATGLTPGAVGNVLQFGVDYENRQSRPKDTADVLRGLARGHIPKPEKSR